MECRICSSTQLELVIDLGLQPWCNNFLKADQIGKEPFYPLQVFFCQNCTSAQLGHTVPKEVMFGDHTYLSGVTKSLDKHFSAIAEQVDTTFFSSKHSKSVCDIGSNDGSQLKHYKRLGYDVIGVESSKTTAQIANNNHIETINTYYSLELMQTIGRKFDVINASGVFFHLEDLHSVTAGIKYSLANNGVFVVQFLYVKNIIENCAFDQIYHEHLLYYSLKSIQCLLASYDLELFDAYIAPIHGGSIIGFVGHRGHYKQSQRLKDLILKEDIAMINDIQTYHKFSDRIIQMRNENIHYIEGARSKGKTIYGMGAPVKGNTLLNYLKVTPKQISYLVEKNPLRRNLFAPGSHIPVILEDDVASPPDIYYVLAWNFKDEILQNHKNLIQQGVEFYFPVDL